MFTKMRNLQKQIDIVFYPLTSERQTVQRDHGRNIKAEGYNQPVEAGKDPVPDQSQESPERHRQGGELNQQPDREHQGQPEHQQHEPKPDAQPQDEKRGR
jgi:hypothetical protein